MGGWGESRGPERPADWADRAAEGFFADPRPVGGQVEPPLPVPMAAVTARLLAGRNLAEAVREWLRRPTTGNASAVEQALVSYDAAPPPMVHQVYRGGAFRQ